MTSQATAKPVTESQSPRGEPAASREVLEFDLDIAKREVQLAEEKVAFTKRLINKGYKSPSDLDAAELELLKVQRTVKQLETLIDAARQTRGDRNPITPEAGRSASPPQQHRTDVAQPPVEQSSVTRPLDVSVHTPSQIMRAFAAEGKDYRLLRDGTLIPALDYISSDPVFRGDHWFVNDKTGVHAHASTVPYAFESYPNQFAAWLVETGVPLDHTLMAEGTQVSLREVVGHAQRRFDPSENQTWTLMLFARTFDVDEEWTDRFGRRWKLADLVRLELQEPELSPELTTWRLYAVAVARNAWHDRYGDYVGIWADADETLREMASVLRARQSPEGHLGLISTQGASDEKPFARTGMNLIWLAEALPPQELGQDWIRRAVKVTSDGLQGAARVPLRADQYAGAVHGLRAVAEALDEPRLHNRVSDER